MHEDQGAIQEHRDQKEPDGLPAVHVRCVKCGTEMRITPVDESAQITLYRLATNIDRRWDDCPACPMCKYTRGGNYPLLRVQSDEEIAAIAEFKLAVAAERAATQPPGDTPEGASVEEEDAWSDAWTAYDGIIDRADAAEKRLRALGIPRDCLLELAGAR